MLTNDELLDMDAGSLRALVAKLQDDIVRLQGDDWPSDEDLSEQVREALNS